MLQYCRRIGGWLSFWRVCDNYASMTHLWIIYAHFPYRWNSNIVNSFPATWLIWGRTFRHQHWNKDVANDDWFVHMAFSSDRYGVLSLAGLYTLLTCTKDCTDILNEVWKWKESKNSTLPFNIHSLQTDLNLKNSETFPVFQELKFR